MPSNYYYPFELNHSHPVVQQDTTLNVDTLKVAGNTKDTTQRLSPVQDIQDQPQIPRTMNLETMDSLMKAANEREQQIVQQMEQARIQRWIYRSYRRDTANILYEVTGSADTNIRDTYNENEANYNFYLNFYSFKSDANVDQRPVFLESQPDQKAIQEVSGTNEPKSLTPKYIDRGFQFDWITGVLIVSFLLIGSARLFYNRFLGSVFRSLINYKHANTLYKEKNSLTQRASFLMNLLYNTTISLLLFQIFNFYEIGLTGISPIQSFFIFFGSIASFYVFRILTSSFIGFVFLRQRAFQEYFHNVNLFNKNLGVFVLPIVILIQFLTYNVHQFLIILSFFIIGIVYLLQTFRAFEIFVRKNISLLYMILYLCAFEFVPFLLIYQAMYSVVG